jgi:hypothetical protein
MRWWHCHRQTAGALRARQSSLGDAGGSIPPDGTVTAADGAVSSSITRTVWGVVPQAHVRCARNRMITSFAPRCSGVLFRCGAQPENAGTTAHPRCPGGPRRRRTRTPCTALNPSPRTRQALANTSGVGEHLRHWRTPQALANTAHAADSVCRTTDLGRGRSSTGQRWAGSCARGDVAELGRRAAPGPGDLGAQRCARTSSPAHCSRGRHPRRKIAGGCSTISNGGAERFRPGCPTVCCPPVTRRAYGRGPGSTGP